MKTRQVILITGSTRGLGKHLRQHLTAQGHDVYGSARAEVPGDDHHLSLDVTDAAAAAKAVQTVIARAGRLDVLINNAGSHLLGAALETSDVELRCRSSRGRSTACSRRHGRSSAPPSTASSRASSCCAPSHRVPRSSKRC